MKKFLILLFIITLNLNVFSQVSEHKFDQNVEVPVKLDYVLYTPDGYKDSQKDYPLIVFLHGAGERGTDLSKVSVHGPLNYIKQGNKIEAVILAPQCPEGVYWRAHEVAELVKQVIKENRIDERRVYLTGLSMGGYGVWATGGEYPELFAAMTPICGAIYRPIYRNISHIEKMPIWVFHGALDNVVSPTNSNEMVKTLKAAGNDVKYTVYPFANHNSWTETYNNPELYKWMLAQKKLIN